MKKVVFYIVLFCVVIMLSGFKYESAVEQQISVAERNGISDALPESAEKILESLGLDDISADSLSNLPLDDIIRLIGESIKEEVKAPFIAIVSVCAAGILCSVINNFGKGETKTVYCTVCTLAVSAAVIIPVKDVIYSAAKVITECSDFMLGFIPIYSSVIAASGGISAAARAASARTQLRRGMVEPVRRAVAAHCGDGGGHGGACVADGEDRAPSARRMVADDGRRRRRRQPH